MTKVKKLGLFIKFEVASATLLEIEDASVAQDDVIKWHEHKLDDISDETHNDDSQPTKFAEFVEYERISFEELYLPHLTNKLVRT